MEMAIRGDRSRVALGGHCPSGRKRRRRTDPAQDHEPGSGRDPKGVSKNQTAGKLRPVSLHREIAARAFLPTSRRRRCSPWSRSWLARARRLAEDRAGEGWEVDQRRSAARWGLRLSGFQRDARSHVRVTHPKESRSSVARHSGAFNARSKPIDQSVRSRQRQQPHSPWHRTCA